MPTLSAEPAERGAGSYRPIRDDAIVGDCQGAALVARDGGVEWCCLGRFDAEPVFGRTLDAKPAICCRRWIAQGRRMLQYSSRPPWATLSRR